MIDNDLYEQVLESGLSLDHFLLLYKLKKGQPSLQNKRVIGFANLLILKGFISPEGDLTEKAFNLLEGYEEVVASKPKNPEVTKWASEVWVKLQDKLMEVTGKKQVQAVVGKAKFPFLCNNIDLAKKLTTVINLYRLKDLDKIERTLLKHIENCSDSNNWFPLMKYYILKDGNSALVTDLESIDEEEDQGYTSSQKFL